MRPSKQYSVPMSMQITSTDRSNFYSESEDWPFESENDFVSAYTSSSDLSSLSDNSTFQWFPSNATAGSSGAGWMSGLDLFDFANASSFSGLPYGQQPQSDGTPALEANLMPSSSQLGRNRTASDLERGDSPTTATSGPHPNTQTVELTQTGLDRRKAQNRAAQRAFRDRKEKHVKELQRQVKTLSAERASLQKSTQALRRSFHSILIQNEVLRAKAGISEDSVVSSMALKARMSLVGNGGDDLGHVDGFSQANVLASSEEDS
ncbi:hypothetical protein M409DRAFT_18551 [Zasmidium cellare ATCC 36951]|uniref:BZIP domain-containing protein n=1 Tax=Zasmidium cellare ATCC 36951 TaxID=1080233 RepID=A0A6A6CWB9_ZASCE|nr:uncharacterized protein M409DRAFT_18551 [Zasmidium cellare ATCC 36951]KAF2171434.1 hypothetical protein M409DRAFT_18551 [Zasmidium cellare ATCC 36951]